MEFFRRTYAEINLENLTDNWQLIKSIAGDDRFVCPMIKANAYGHGANEVAFSLEQIGAKVFGVSLIEEGLSLRNGGIKSEVLVFGGFDKVGAEKIVEYQMTPVVSSWSQLKALEAVADAPLKVHIKFETGMNRLGFKSDEVEKLSDYFKKSKMLKLKAVLSHLACSEDALQASGKTAVQLEKMSAIENYFSDFDIYAHILNSGGILNLAEQKKQKNKDGTKNLIEKNWGFRPGLMLYGYAPNENLKNSKLKPVMTFKSYISQTQVVAQDETVSYGGTWKASRKSVIGIVSAGYADGINRRISNKTSVLVGETKVPLVGSVCMDFIMLDLTDLIEKNNKQNWQDEEVVLFGYDEQMNFISADEWAQLTQSVSWEVLTSVSYRVPRHFKGLKKS